MSAVIRWEDPPPPEQGKKAGTPSVDWRATRTEVRDAGGRWAVVAEFAAEEPYLAERLARRIRLGKGVWSGGFDSAARQLRGIPTVYARYVGEATT